MKSIIICLAQSKGGTLKTSSTLNIGACLVQQGYKVLVIDLDQQCNLTISLGVDPVNSEYSVFHLITDSRVTATDVIVSTDEGVDLMPASIELGVLDLSISEKLGRERLLSKKLRAIRNSYDFILIDTAPSFGTATLNGMTAADYLLIPVEPEPLCVHGLKTLVTTFNEVQENSNPNLQILGIFITKYNTRLSAHREIADNLKKDWGQDNLAFDTCIRNRSNMLDASARTQSIVSYQRSSDLAQDYIALTKEILAHVEQQ